MGAACWNPSIYSLRGNLGGRNKAICSWPCGRSWMDQTSFDAGAIRSFGSDGGKFVGTMAVRHFDRNNAVGRAIRSGFLDVVMGTSWTAALHPFDRLPGHD